MITPLTKRRVEAILEALNARLAAEIEDVGDLKYEDYQAALEWAREQLRRRKPESAQ